MPSILLITWFVGSHRLDAANQVRSRRSYWKTIHQNSPLWLTEKKQRGQIEKEINNLIWFPYLGFQKQTLRKMNMSDFFNRTSSRYLVFECRLQKFDCKNEWKIRWTINGMCLELDVRRVHEAIFTSFIIYVWLVYVFINCY